MTNQLDKNNLLDILQKSDLISHIKDVDSLLDRVLKEARAITNADAGSIYLSRGDKLTFEYVQNDTLMKGDSTANKYLYSKREIEINNDSISGYVALNRKPLLIDDVYQLGADVPYTFNRTFDENSSYHTQSVLTVPLITSRDSLTGVLQIINAKNEDNEVVPFSKEDELLVSLFANQAAVAIERARMTREIILRMIRIAELRDPKETGAHVNRVGAYSIEIYQRWASKRNIPEKSIKRMKDILRIAAMLHDVGKVAISDSILKKKARLDTDEFNEMKWHTVFGARLFENSNSDWDDMAIEIALNHHEKWDGSGYPGQIENIFKDDITPGTPGKKGEDIPITARIVALADVYDALMSKRTYKDSWSEEDTLEYVKAQTYTHFDPEVVEAFFEIYDVIRAIRAKYN
ncbi:MAG: HD domain-containing protein [bacterium]|nr:HD domain-containing protein [bacterium]